MHFSLSLPLLVLLTLCDCWFVIDSLADCIQGPHIIVTVCLIINFLGPCLALFSDNNGLITNHLNRESHSFHQTR